MKFFFLKVAKYYNLYLDKMAHDHDYQEEEENWHLQHFVEDCNSGVDQDFNPNIHYHPYRQVEQDTCEICHLRADDLTSHSFRGTSGAGVVRSGKFCSTCLDYIHNNILPVEEEHLQCFHCGVLTNDKVLCPDCGEELYEQERRDRRDMEERFDWRDRGYGDFD